jgi:hypothetical protein
MMRNSPTLYMCSTRNHTLMRALDHQSISAQQKTLSIDITDYAPPPSYYFLFYFLHHFCSSFLSSAHSPLFVYIKYSCRTVSMALATLVVSAPSIFPFFGQPNQD